MYCSEPLLKWWLILVFPSSSNSITVIGLLGHAAWWSILSSNVFNPDLVIFCFQYVFLLNSTPTAMLVMFPYRHKKYLSCFFNNKVPFIQDFSCSHWYLWDTYFTKALALDTTSSNMPLYVSYFLIIRKMKAYFYPSTASLECFGQRT